MRATLWQDHTEASVVVREVLCLLFRLATIPLSVVSTQDELLTAAARAKRTGDDDILLIDCFAGVPSDVDRCAAIVTRTTLTVYIIHPREETVRALEEIAGRPLHWLPPDFTIPGLLDRLHALRALAAAEAARRPALTPREREVLDQIATGRTNAQIGAHLHISDDTVKTHVRAIMRKVGVRTRRELSGIVHPSRTG